MLKITSACVFLLFVGISFALTAPCARGSSSGSSNTTNTTTTTSLYTITKGPNGQVTISASPSELLNMNIFGQINRTASPSSPTPGEGDQSHLLSCYAQTATEAEYELLLAYTHLLNSSSNTTNTTSNPPPTTTTTTTKTTSSSSSSSSSIFEQIIAWKMKSLANNAALYNLLTGSNVTFTFNQTLNSSLFGDLFNSSSSSSSNSSNSSNSSSDTKATDIMLLMEREIDLGGLYTQAYLSTSDLIAQYVFFMGEQNANRDLSWLTMLSFEFVVAENQTFTLPTPSSKMHLLSVLLGTIVSSVCPVYAPFFGAMGVVAGLSFTVIGAGYGIAKSSVGISSMGVMKPELVIRAIIPVIFAGALSVYGLIIAVIIQSNLTNPNSNYTLKKSFLDLGGGLTVGLCGMAAGMSIGVTGDSGVRGFGQQPKLYVGMVLVLIFAEALGLFGLIIALLLANAKDTQGADCYPNLPVAPK